MSILPLGPGDFDENGNLKVPLEPIFSPFYTTPHLRAVLEEKKRKEAEQLKPLEFGYIKQRGVRLWALAHIQPEKGFFSNKRKEPYYQGFWVQAPTINDALKAARWDTEEFPAVINLYIANTPSEKSLAVGSSQDGKTWRWINCPKMESLPKRDLSKGTKLAFSATVGIGAMILLSLLWPRELFRFSWILSIAGIGLFFAWRKYGDSEHVGEFLNSFRPAKKVNIAEDWCPSLEDFK